MDAARYGRADDIRELLAEGADIECNVSVRSLFSVSMCLFHFVYVGMQEEVLLELRFVSFYFNSILDWFPGASIFWL